MRMPWTALLAVLLLGLAACEQAQDNKPGLIGTWSFEFSGFDITQSPPTCLKVSGTKTYSANGTASFDGSFTLATGASAALEVPVIATMAWQFKDGVITESIAEYTIDPADTLSVTVMMHYVERLLADAIPRNLTASSTVVRLDDKEMILKDLGTGGVFIAVRVAD